MKVFCIGFQKTGTSTMGIVLKKLGFKVIGLQSNCAQFIVDKNFKPIFEIVDSFDAFQDNPWPILYKQLDEKYPNSKFILTVRDQSKWIRSVINHFGNKNTLMRQIIYDGNGSPIGNEKKYLKIFNTHNKEVMDYFKNRPKDILKINIEKTTSWNEICNFLDKPIPNSKFPHANKNKYKKLYSTKLFLRKFKNKIIRFLKYLTIR